MNGAGAICRLSSSLVLEPTLRIFEVRTSDKSDVKSDEELILLVAEKDETAFEILVDRYMKDIHGFAYRFCQDRATAEDLTQDTFLRVWQRASTWIPGKVRFTTWIHQITRNLCIDRYRKNEPEFVDEQALENIPSVMSTTVDSNLIDAQIQKSVAALPERQRTAFLFCQVQGWSQTDAAAVLGVTVEAVEGLLARARRTLRKRLTGMRD